MQAEQTSDITRILSTLIGFPTTFHDSNLALIEWIRDYLARQGIRSHLDFDTQARKANLLASIGPDSDEGIVLSGHTDVVPVTDQVWESDPFQARLHGTRLYGRGACDMKGFIAAVLAQVPHWKDLPLRRPLHLAFSYDEEIGCIGVRTLLEHMRAVGLRASGCIVGEPTDMQPVIAHKGRICGEYTVRGKAVHSSLAPDGVNAIAYAARMITFIQDLARQESVEGLRQSGFDVPFSTLAVTQVHGGSAPNIIPNHCRLTFDYRYLPGIDPSRVLASIEAYKEVLVDEMRVVDGDAGIQGKHEATSLTLDTAENSQLAQLTRSLSRATGTRKVAFSSEAGHFEQYGIPAIVCGPGSIAQAHRPNEYIELSQLSACARFLAELGQRMCAH